MRNSPLLRMTAALVFVCGAALQGCGAGLCEPTDAAMWQQLLPFDASLEGFTHSNAGTMVATAQVQASSVACGSGALALDLMSYQLGDALNLDRSFDVAPVEKTKVELEFLLGTTDGAMRTPVEVAMWAGGSSVVAERDQRIDNTFKLGGGDNSFAWKRVRQQFDANRTTTGTVYLRIALRTGTPVDMGRNPPRTYFIDQLRLAFRPST